MPAPRWLKWAEKLALFVALLSIWPVILGREHAFWRHPGWTVFMYVMLGILALMFAANVVRLSRMGHPRGDDAEGGPPRPGMRP
jgi:1,4-dihydroxy-2-naphthoate octaprenyltransferase